MKLRLIKVGNSWNVRVPMKVAMPFIDAGEIEVVFPGEEPVVNQETGEVKADMGMQEKLATLRTMMDMAGQENSLTPPVEAPVVEAYSDDERYSEDEIPAEYIMKQ